MSITLLATKGNGLGEQGNFLDTLFGETSAYYEGGSARTIDINSLAQSDNIGPSAGGQAQEQDGQQFLLSATIQQNSILPYNSVINSLEDLAESNEVITYTVQEGDVLSLIARDYGVSTNSLIWANNLRNANSISVGQDLKIPPVSGVIHKVVNGDTVGSLVSKYGADIDEIIAFNGLSEDGKLSIGMDIIIPGGEINAIPQQSSSTVRLAQTVPFANLPRIVGYFFHPTGGLGRISQWVHGRNGIDVANSCGTPIYAAADGKVSNALSSGWNGGYGNYVKISHPNGTSTLYAHLWTLSVGAGENVSKGQKIGAMGTTGRSTGCHVHFEVHGAQNPLSG